MKSIKISHKPIIIIKRSDPSGIDNATLTDYFNGINVTFKGSQVPVAAVSGALHRYKVLSINDETPDPELSAAADEDLFIVLLPGTNVIKLITVVNTTDGCGVLESQEFIELHYCRSEFRVWSKLVLVHVETIYKN